ncbi:hypothetical protein [Pelagibius sp. Alg239-R121]|uniref:hypothetical protein n=1 Tax=Pelagibius sp. Alg239-R121 TaxID=2993448 RepID=UPI0024A7159C|nr:hypothetical protein [Pelagibius sp. Alg239-R121]
MKKVVWTAIIFASGLTILTDPTHGAEQRTRIEVSANRVMTGRYDIAAIKHEIAQCESAITAGSPIPESDHPPYDSDQGLDPELLGMPINALRTMVDELYQKADNLEFELHKCRSNHKKTVQ